MAFPHSRTGLAHTAAWTRLACLALLAAAAQAAAGAGVIGYVEVMEQDAHEGLRLDGAAALAVSQDGMRLYAASPADSALAVFERDLENGRLTFLRSYVDQSLGGDIDGLSGVIDVAVSPDGTAVYAVSGNDDALVLFGKTEGGLAHIETYRTGTHGIAGLGVPERVAVSPDGAHVYVATRKPDAPDAVLAFRVVDGVGGLAPIGSYETDMDDVSALAFSPDGRHLYVAEAAGLTALARDNDPASVDYGRLTLVAAWRPGEDDVEGMAGASAIALDPSGSHVYVAGPLDHAVTAFERDADTGLLAPLRSYLNGTDGIDGMARPFDLAVSPDGGHVYVTANLDHALVVLRRERDTGLLSYLETHRDGDDDPVEGLHRALGVALSPDGANLYTASPLEKKIGVFAVPAADLSLAVTGGAEADAQEADFQIIVSNAGPADAEGVRLSGPMPEEIADASFDAPAGISCTQSPQRIACELGTLPAGGMIAIDLHVEFEPPVAITYTGAVSAAQRDPDLSNNTDSAVITATASEDDEDDPTPNPPPRRRSGGGAADGMFMLIAALALAARLRRGRAHDTIG